jgi:hypothetical protein
MLTTWPARSTSSWTWSATSVEHIRHPNPGRTKAAGSVRGGARNPTMLVTAGPAWLIASHARAESETPRA